MAMSPIAELGTAYLKTRAGELGDAVLREKKPKAARAYIGWILELVPTVYKPAPGTLATALDLVVEDMLQGGLSPAQMADNYRFFQHVASMYNLQDRVASYAAEIAKLNGLIRR